MFKIITVPLIALGVLTTSVPHSYALSCIQEDLSDKRARADLVVAVTAENYLGIKNKSHMWNVSVEETFKGSTEESFTLQEQVWPDATADNTNFKADTIYLVFLQEPYEGDADWTQGMCDWPRNIGKEPLTPNERVALNGTNNPTISCDDYECRDGSRFPSCTADGVQIAYLVAPCSTHGGDADEFTPTQPVLFTDIPSTHPHALAIEWAQETNLIQGYSDSTFRPDNTINRAEFLKILLEPVGPVCRAYFPYTDVNFGAWYGDYVQLASCQALVKGYSDGTFRPAANINVAEAAKIIVKYHSQGSVEQASTADWYTPFVSYLQLRNAFPSTIEFANDELTRAEMVAMMYALNTYDEGQYVGGEDSDLNPDNEEDCLAAGGDWSIHGLLPQPSCSLPTKDANALCMDSDECQAGCIYPYQDSDANVGYEVIGQCQETTSPFGCFAFVEDGKLQPTLCID